MDSTKLKSSKEAIVVKNYSFQVAMQRLGDRIRNFTCELLKVTQPMVNSLAQLKDSELLKTITDFAVVLAEAERDPESKLNYYNYIIKMNDYFWVMPYSLSTIELKTIINTKPDEKRFDEFMKEHFDKVKVSNLFKDVRSSIPYGYKTIFMQVEEAFYASEYILVNNALISIIDGLLSIFLFSKVDTSRIDFLVPIINDIEEKQEDNYIVFIIFMINNSINRLYENIDFDKPIIKTSKKVRRHVAQHGVRFSNNKIDSLMLMNLLYYILEITGDLKKYHHRLKYNRKEHKYILK